jgi:hypothetical protein
MNTGESEKRKGRESPKSQGGLTGNKEAISSKSDESRSAESVWDLLFALLEEDR